ncbi:MAG: protein kinase [Polyangiales bacterium]
MAVAVADHGRIGAVVAGRYRLVRVLGRGGMGIVYEAERTTDQRHVAIKVMHPEEQVVSENARRFMHEAAAAGLLKHPNVVEVLDQGQDPADGSLYIVLELLTGIDLATYLTRYEKLLPSETLTVVCQVLQALIVAHREGVVHRDIKPENIFLARRASGDTHVKIVDFGISKVINPEKNLPLSITLANTTVGTPHYMAPEQAKGEKVDPRADIWAVGVVMYECLTGEIPFDGENFNSQIVALVTEPHRPAAELGVEPDLSAIVDRCLEKNRDDRFASAADMLDAIRAYLDAHPEVAVRRALLDVTPDPEPAVDGRSDTVQSAVEPANDPAASIAPENSEERLTPAHEGLPEDLSHPVFPGMVPLDEEDDDNRADSAPTTVRAIVSGGYAPLPLSQRPGAPSDRPPPPGPVSDTPPASIIISRSVAPSALRGPTLPGGGHPMVPSLPRPPPVPRFDLEPAAPPADIASVPPPPLVSEAPVEAPPARGPWVFIAVAVVSALLAAGGGYALFSAVRAPVPSPAQAARSRVRFIGLRDGATLSVGGVPHYSTEAYVRRGTDPIAVRVEAEGFAPLEFNLVPDRDLDVALPPMAPLPAEPAQPVEPPPAPEPAPRPREATPAPETAPAPTPEPSRAAHASRPSRSSLVEVAIGASERCAVTIDGRSVGQTPVYRQRLSPGTHTITCARPGGAAQRRSVEVAGPGPQRVFFEGH